MGDGLFGEPVLVARVVIRCRSRPGYLFPFSGIPFAPLLGFPGRILGSPGLRKKDRKPGFGCCCRLGLSRGRQEA
jgi:hypothetical protein